jgi:hypothetical protein
LSRRSRPRIDSSHSPNWASVRAYNGIIALNIGVKGVKLVVTIQPDGRVAFDGQPYDSLSAAGGMARKTVVGAPAGKPYPSTNGWIFWQFRDPTTGELLEVESLRQAFLAAKR